MTTIYMVRSATCEEIQDMNSEMNETGKKEVTAIEGFFQGKEIDALYLSSNKSAADTMKFMTSEGKIKTSVTEEFNERKIGPRVANLESFTRRQWQELEYQLPDGESFLTTQDRMIDGLEKVVTISKDKTSVICSHSFALATVIHFFDGTFSFEEYMSTTRIHPWIIKMKFDNKTLVSMETIRCM